jgi:cyclophilin family peptidyl-prolyl cis-trans isomerase
MNEKLIFILPVAGICIALVLLFNYNLNKVEEPKDNVAKLLKNSEPSNVNNSNAQESTPNMNQPEMKIDVNKKYQAKFSTNYGDFTISLYAKETPITVNNFVTLARNKFYDGLVFHRVIEDFMIQGGDPKGNGTGGPGYTFQDETSPKKLVKGSLAMANAGPNTNGSQFFIVTATETPWLDGKHTNFGEVVSGLDVVEKIGKVETGVNDRPVKDVVINSIEIIEE